MDDPMTSPFLDVLDHLGTDARVLMERARFGECATMLLAAEEIGRLRRIEAAAAAFIAARDALRVAKGIMPPEGQQYIDALGVLEASLAPVVWIPESPDA